MNIELLRMHGMEDWKSTSFVLLVAQIAFMAPPLKVVVTGTTAIGALVAPLSPPFPARFSTAEKACLAALPHLW
jgi:hypothetical protein